MKTFIKVSDRLRKELMDRFNVTRAAVWAALNFLTRGGRGPAIRQYALDNGGFIVEEDFLPNCRTEHTLDEIIQTFAGGIEVRISKVDSSAAILCDGEVIERYDAITTQSWGNLLSRAQDLSAQQLEKKMATV